MFSFFSFQLAVVVSVLFFIGSVKSAPADTGIQLPRRIQPPPTGIQPSSTVIPLPLTGIPPLPTGIQPPQVPPRFAIYSDKFVGSGVVPDASVLRGYNVLILSFLLTSGPVDQAFEWTQLSAQERTDILASYHSAGIVIMASAFGSTDTPTTDGVDPVAAAMSVADFVIEFDLDGIDVDYEDTTALFSGGAVDWLVTFTQTLRAALPADSLMSHAPQGPHFGPGFLDGGYLAVDEAVGPLIDWYNVQFYNQGVTEYVDCPGLLTQSSSNNPRTSVFEIAASGVPLQKIVIGKPASVADANNGFMPTDVLAQCVAQAKGMEWSAGAMLFQFSTELAIWIETVRGTSFPIPPTQG